MATRVESSNPHSSQNLPKEGDRSHSNGKISSTPGNQTTITPLDNKISPDYSDKHILTGNKSGFDKPTNKTRILPIDPETLGHSLNSSKNTSPKYPVSPKPGQMSPPLGSILRTSPDLTPSQIQGKDSLPTIPKMSSQIPSSHTVPLRPTLHTRSKQIPLMSTGTPIETSSPAINPINSSTRSNESEYLSEFISSLPGALNRTPVRPVPIPETTQTANSSRVPQPSQTYRSPVNSNPSTYSTNRNSYPEHSNYSGYSTRPNYSDYSNRPNYSDYSNPSQPYQSPAKIHTQKVNEAKFRADYRVKFDILREAYPQMNIPDPEDSKSVDEIQAEYREYVKRILIDSSVEQNKVYLLILWLVIELVGCKLMRLPFSGYTQNQFKYMNKYQMLLIELGENAAETGLGSGWPVETRILFLAVFNGVIFIMVKLLADKIGDGMAEELSNMISSFLTENRGVNVLRRAETADSTNPPPPLDPQDATPPLGGLGNIIAQMAGAFMNNNNSNDKPASKPQVKRPTTFASRRRKNPNNQE